MTVTSASTLDLAKEVATALQAKGVQPLLIGAVALAVHGYARQTTDIDFAVVDSVQGLTTFAEGLRAPNREVSVELPDDADPLGGVVTIEQASALPVQVINFDNPPASGLPALVKDALTRANDFAGMPTRVASIEDLMLFKLYAGGPKSRLDILETMTRCQVDLEKLSKLAALYRLDQPLLSVLQVVGLG